MLENNVKDQFHQPCKKLRIIAQSHTRNEERSILHALQQRLTGLVTHCVKAPSETRLEGQKGTEDDGEDVNSLWMPLRNEILNF